MGPRRDRRRHRPRRSRPRSREQDSRHLGPALARPRGCRGCCADRCGNASRAHPGHGRARRPELSRGPTSTTWRWPTARSRGAAQKPRRARPATSGALVRACARSAAEQRRRVRRPARPGVLPGAADRPGATSRRPRRGRRGDAVLTSSSSAYVHAPSRDRREGPGRRRPAVTADRRRRHQAGARRTSSTSGRPVDPASTSTPPRPRSRRAPRGLDAPISDTTTSFAVSADAVARPRPTRVREGCR